MAIRIWLISPGNVRLLYFEIVTKGADTRHIPIVIVTTKDQETDRVWGKRQGARDYLTKPVDEAVLLKTVERQLTGA